VGSGETREKYGRLMRSHMLQAKAKTVANKMTAQPDPSLLSRVLRPVRMMRLCRSRMMMTGRSRMSSGVRSSPGYRGGGAEPKLTSGS
jgi:hypothetical protein